MKKLYLVICLITLNFSFGEEPKVYEYYLYLNDYRMAPKFEKSDKFSYYSGNSKRLEKFFNNYVIFEFSQAFPDFSNSEKILNVFILRTSNKKLVTDLIREYPDLYYKYDDITGRIVEPLDYYPNDYGNTNPNTNLGASVSKKDLDYLKVPKAWGITKGNDNIKIGISDTQINSTAQDFNGKVQFVSGYNGNTTGISHGSNVSAMAAARGDNAHGAVGVCMDCDILAAPMGFGSTSQIAFTNLYKLANEGARVINMSWHNGFGHVNAGQGYIQVEQDIINYLVNEYDIVFVGAAGNMNSYSTAESFYSLEINGVPNGVPLTPFGLLYIYPASYDNVISVSNVNHQNPINLPMNNSQASYCCTSPWFPVHVDVEDAVGRSVNALDPMNPISVIRNGYYINQYNPDGLQWQATTNEKVDILAPGYNIFQYSDFLNVGQLYGWGTSYAAPQVAGTVGLMFAVNECLTSQEVEDIIQLTSKDVEHLPLNQYFVGHIGAGSLKTGDAVEFVDEMKKINGNAVIKNHIFSRFDFKLSKINNQLTLSNITFEKYCNADFTAKKVIDLQNSDFNPGNNSIVDFKIDTSIDVSCNLSAKKREKFKSNKENKNVIPSSISKLFPNPNNGTFSITLNKQFTDITTFEIFDVFGKSIYKGSSDEHSFNVNILNLTSGMYMIKLSSNSYSETLKFIKQ
jgi:subtilisin family serine protease